MARLTTALAVLFLALSPAFGTVAPRKGDPDVRRDLLSQCEKADPPRQDVRLVLTDKTEIRLDGRACKLQDIPRGADVIQVDVAADRKTILRIHFRSKK